MNSRGGILRLRLAWVTLKKRHATRRLEQAERDRESYLDSIARARRVLNTIPEWRGR